MAAAVGFTATYDVSTLLYAFSVHQQVNGCGDVDHRNRHDPVQDLVDKGDVVYPQIRSRFPAPAAASHNGNVNLWRHHCAEESCHNREAQSYTKGRLPSND